MTQPVAPLVVAEQGSFFVGVERREIAGRLFAAGQMHVQYQVPAERRHALPLVLVHGGGGQGLDYLSTPDGRPGWATWFLRQGYAVYVVDRPIHGRSPYHPDIDGPAASPMDYALASALFTAPAARGTYPRAARHSQWPGSGEVGDPALDQLIAGMGPMQDLETAEAAMAAAAEALLDRIGKAILVVHSAGGAFAWHAADRRPGLVAAIVAIEVLGPPFAALPFGRLAYGLTALPLAFDPPAGEAGLTTTPREAPAPGLDGCLVQAEPARRLPNLSNVPILVVTAEASWVAAHGHGACDFLRQAGAPAEHLRLDEAGITGNGHMVMSEKNSDEVAAALDRWLAGKGF